jgi:hypothetical protein
MKILFLDIDGVLNDNTFNAAAESSTLDPAAVARLNQVLRTTGAKLVLSSSWRYLILDRAMTLQGFEYLLRTHGLDKGCLIGLTGPDEEGPGRAAQIQRWLADNGRITDWAVLDDAALDLGEVRWRHVRPDRGAGLSDADAAQLIAILTRPGSG